MWTSIGKAFSLVFSGDPYLGKIISTTLEMAFASSVISLILGAPIGVLISISKFKGKSIVTTIERTFMGLPPVAVGILIYVLFSGTGPFGKLGLIYSVPLMVIAQVVLIVPIVSGMTDTYISAGADNLIETTKGLNLNKGKTFFIAVSESKYQLIATYLFAFSRAISEVGAVQIVGGNILYKTRVMTTTIALNYNTGQFDYAIALGVLLLIISLIVNCAATIIQKKLK